MAYYSIFPEKDTTIYSHPDRRDLNTGQDEILELVEEQHNNSGSVYYSSRILIKFSDSDIKNVFDTQIPAAKHTAGQYTASLQLFGAEHKNVSDTYTLEVYGISQSWAEGTGRWTQNPTSSVGATWTNNKSGSAWRTSSFGSNGITGSAYMGNQLTRGGGTWYEDDGVGWPYGSVIDVPVDIDVDVSPIITLMSGNIANASVTYPVAMPNDGFIIKKEGGTELDDMNFGELKYFSSKTHTIYPPKLTFKWDDSSYHYLVADGHTGSFEVGDDMVIVLDNNKAEYQRASKQRFKLTTRKRYPTISFTTSSNYLTNTQLPSSSYYSIRDAHTDEVIIPFDSKFTKLSVGSNRKAYFDLHMGGLQPERYYKILFKVDIDPSSVIIDDDYYFKVVR